MKYPIYLTSLLMALSGPVLAAGVSSTTSSEFQRLDSNSDGVITAGELNNEPALQENWSAIDQNGDGTLDQSEFSAFESMGDPGIDATPSSSPGMGNPVQ